MCLHVISESLVTTRASTNIYTLKYVFMGGRLFMANVYIYMSKANLKPGSCVTTYIYEEPNMGYMQLHITPESPVTKKTSVYMYICINAYNIHN